MSVRTAVFPVAGLGTRFLPATKAVPKELLPIVDRPLVQYAVEEAIAAGVSDIIFVVGPTKSPIEAHFQPADRLVESLRTKGEDGLAAAVERTTPAGVRFHSAVQDEPSGLGHAVLQARALVGEDPFFVVLPDDLMIGEPGCLAQMLGAWEDLGTSLVVTQQVPREQSGRYGIVSGERVGDRSMKLDVMVEKPAPADAPSDEGIVGRYLLTPRIWEHLEGLGAGAGGEIQLTDAIAALIPEEGVHALRFDGQRYDCGSKLGFLQAAVELGKRDPDIGSAFSDWLTDDVAR